MVFLPSTLMDATELPKIVLFNSVDCKTKVSSASFAFSCHFLWFFTMNNKPGGISVNTGSSVNNSVPLVLLPTALQKPQRLRQESTGTLFFSCMLHTGRMLSQKASGFEPLFRVSCIFGAWHPDAVISFTSWFFHGPPQVIWCVCPQNRWFCLCKEVKLINWAKTCRTETLPFNH